MPALLVLCLHLSIGRIRTSVAPSGDPANESSKQTRKIQSWLLSHVAMFLEVMTVPIFLGSLVMPQAPLYYWMPGVATSLLLQRAAGGPQQERGYQGRGFPGTPDHAPDAHDSMSLSQEASTLMVQAAQQQAARRPLLAQRLLHQVLLLHPGHPNATFAMGQVQAALKEWQKSEACYSSVIAHTRTSGDTRLLQRALFGAGVAQSKLDLMDAALASFTSATANEYPDQDIRVRSFIAMSTIQKRQGDIQQAIRSLELASRLEPRVRELYLAPLLADAKKTGGSSSSSSSSSS